MVEKGEFCDVIDAIVKQLSSIKYYKITIIKDCISFLQISFLYIYSETLFAIKLCNYNLIKKSELFLSC